MVGYASERKFDIGVWIVAAVITLIVLYPLVFVLSASISNPADVATGRMWLIPMGINFNAYIQVFHDSQIWNGYWNTIRYTVIGTLLNVILTIMIAYPLSRKELPGRNLITLIIVFTMFFHGGLIPLYLVVKGLGMINTLWAMVIPTALSTFNIIVMRTYFQTNIPKELEDAAYIDGCSHFRLIWKIVLPLSKPVIAVIALFYAVGHWNAYFNALIYLQNPNLYPLQLVLRNILIMNQTTSFGISALGMQQQVMLAESIKYAIIVIASIPVFIAYPFVQRYFVKGVMIGSLKG